MRYVHKIISLFFKCFFCHLLFIKMSKNKHYKIYLTPSQPEIKPSIMQPIEFISEKDNQMCVVPCFLNKSPILKVRPTLLFLEHG